MQPYQWKYCVSTIEGYEIAYRCIGQGYPIIFLHGFGTSSTTWKLMYPFLRSGYQYIFLDLVGHGKTTREYRNVEPLELHTKLLTEFLKYLNLNRYTLVGHSFGGMLVLRSLPLLQQIPEIQISSLVLIDTPAYPQKLPGVVRFFLLGFLSYIAFRIFPYSLLAYLAELRVFYAPRRIPIELVREYAEHMQVPGTYQCLKQLAKALNKEIKREIIPNHKDILIPTAIICGSHDRIIPFINTQKLNNSLSKSQLFIINKSGHSPQEENPEEMADLINIFLKNFY